jgi:hypothetical protein
MKAERHKLARQAGGGFWLSAPKPFNTTGVIMGNISETGLFEKLAKQQKEEMSIIITIESKEHKNKILQVLEDAEMDGTLNFIFNIKII